jgi:Zn-dependent protease with chaperone function
MINITRVAVLISMICFSSFFIASLVYSAEFTKVDNGMFNMPLFLYSLSVSTSSLLAALLILVSPLGDKIVALFFTTRKKSLREEEVINPAIKRVQQLYRQKFGQDLKIDTYVMDEPHINGLSLGRQSIAVSTGLLKVGSDDEITAILAHEAGHLHNKDGIFNIALLVASLPTIFLNAALKYVLFWGPKPTMPGSNGQSSMFGAGIIVFFILLIFFPYFFVFWLMSFPAILILRAVDMFSAWPIEYRADRFSMNLGLGPAMIELFERIEDEDIRNSTGFMSKYLYSHPPTALRIDKIERNIQGEINACN